MYKHFIRKNGRMISYRAAKFKSGRLVDEYLKDAVECDENGKPLEKKKKAGRPKKK